MTRDALAGRLVLLASAYAPASLIIGARTAPHPGGLVALALGALGLGVWTGFLWLLPRAQPREVVLEEYEPIDAEVTGYIASYLLPIVAASSPSTGDIVAYCICGLLLLIVAFAADLGAVNPVIYLLGLRVGRARIGGVSTIVLVKTPQPSGALVIVTRAIGVVRVMRQVEN